MRYTGACHITVTPLDTEKEGNLLKTEGNMNRTKARRGGDSFCGKQAMWCPSLCEEVIAKTSEYFHSTKS
jgi:hypothetical protein